MLEFDDHIIDAGNPINWSHPTMLPGVRPVAWWLCLPAFMGGAKFRDLMSSPDLRIGNHGTLTNMAQGTASGWRGTRRPGGWGALQSDGTDDYCTTGQSLVGYTGTAAATVSLWARSRVTKVHSPLGDNRYDDSANDSTGIDMFDNNGQFWCRMRTGGTDRTASGGTWTAGVWYQVTATYDGATVSLYANGVLVATAAGTGAIYSSTRTLKLGRRGDTTTFSGGPWWYDGQLDDIRIYNRPLSAAEVRSLYDLSRSGYPGVLRRLSVPMPGIAASRLLMLRRRMVA